MDRETLSNYGWIVIAIVIISIFAVLAVPLAQSVEGRLMSAAIQATPEVGKAPVSGGGIVSGKDAPVILEGNNSEYNLFYAAPIVFKISTGPSAFREIKVNGAVLDAVNYEIATGDNSTTIATIKPVYLSALSVDTYAISFCYGNGVANGLFHVITESVSTLLGDVDLDGDVDSDDLTVLARHVAKIERISHPVALANGDISQDGDIDAEDLTLLAQYLDGTITKFPQGDEVAYLRGDVDLNGVVDSDDITKLSRHLAKIELITAPVALVNADVDENDSVNARDLTLLSQYVGGIIDKWPTEASASLKGDIDLDGDVDQDDNTLLARHIGKIEFITDPVALANADVNEDGDVNTQDLTIHSRFIGGIISEWPAQGSNHSLKGDVDLDGDVDSEDLTKLSRHVAKIEYITNPTALVNADVNEDGDVDSQDITIHARYVGRIISEWPTPVTKSLKGDVDLDGDVDADDTTLISRHIANIAYITDPAAFTNADVNGDGDISAQDLTIHSQYVSGAITDWP